MKRSEVLHHIQEESGVRCDGVKVGGEVRSNNGDLTMEVSCESRR